MDYLKRAEKVVRSAVLHVLSCERAQKDAVSKADFRGQAVGLVTAYNLFVLQAGLKDVEATALLLSIEELDEEINKKFKK